jgi:hypothetical protein
MTNLGTKSVGLVAKAGKLNLSGANGALHQIDSQLASTMAWIGR